MSEEQLKAFLEKVKADTSLQEKLKAAADANAVAAIAKESGFSISVEDINKAQSELSDKELEGVSGGIYPTGTLFPKKAWRWLVNSKERESEKYQN
ncbi:Nif11-like leader peptide family natural product precursor [Prochlorococcus marinus]|uniref:Nif11 domain-containing protein n=1 Tax=Prochlorococcus marinus (strain MIT 9303) TaxID=59922 RepID=A2CDB5_PROM3|nr:Nif11-like leader peptide family natural product precursor [Prochlorococcus marinus]ABM79475.1 Hypothetical protein P9303_27451 [Prochlorococcus marinus str. MIT 9303]